MTGGSGARIQMMQQQADSVTIIAAPVSGTKYEWRTGATGAGAALGTQKNVKIISADALITWATTQPDPLEVHITIDGNAITHIMNNPVTANNYEAQISKHAAESGQALVALNNDRYMNLYEGRSVKIEVEITWATTQPTNLTMRVKWAKIP